ncbi:Triacylglycerol lipase ptl2 [Durusdinium trenchii]|uniref:Triacylglycerol lipase ptl2 n=1 Tax=Durusdinium trenchii TaxID=1381693 RepID=A0ABP0L726_9DINO
MVKIGREVSRMQRHQRANFTAMPDELRQSLVCGMLQGQKVEDLFARKPLAKDLEEQFGVFAWRFAFTVEADELHKIRLAITSLTQTASLPGRTWELESRVITVVLVLYFAIRALIHATEWLCAASETRRARWWMLRAGTMKEYKAAAMELDRANGLEEWKSRPQSRYYAWEVLSSSLVELQSLQEQRDWPKLLRNVVVKCLDELRHEVANKPINDAESEALLAQLQRFTELAVCTFGRTALCLSGGGGMAFQHFGVVEELLRQKLLPKIISGTSGGAAIAAYICCRTDDELLGDCKGATWGHCQTSTMPIFQVQPSITLWAGSWLERVRHYIKFGCVFPREPIERWAETWALGETTFLEAFKRTGRVLNITCSIVAGDSGEQVPLLLNYQTHSHVLIASAVICSGSMPGLLNPSKLLEKCPESGLIRAHCERQTCYADGSIDFDIPSLTLAQAFGVRYTVAVQVNPHVTPFNFAPHGEAGRPISWSSPSGRGRWRGGFILCALEVVLKESFRSAWKVMGLLQLLPRYFGCKWDLFFAQVYEGSVTLSTEDGYFWKCFNALENPSQEAFRYWWRQGRLMVWQKMPLLEAWSKAAAAAVDEDPGDPHRSQFDIKRTYANAIICDICDG